MPKVMSVKKARVDQGQCSKCGTPILAGDSYRWWKFKNGGRHVRCSKGACSPKSSDLTQSEFWKAVYDWQEQEHLVDCEDADACQCAIDDLKSEMEDLRDDLQSRLDNMPESLQESPSGILLQERIEALDTVIGNLEDLGADFDYETEDPGEEPEEPERPEVSANANVDTTGAQGMANCQKELEECKKPHEQWKAEHSQWEEKQQAQEEEFTEWRAQLESEITDALDFSCS